MADVKISALPAATTPLAGTEEVPIVQSGQTRKVAANDIAVNRVAKAGDTMTGDLTLSSTDPAIILNAPGTANTGKVIRGREDDLDRWSLWIGQGSTERFLLTRHDDTGASLGTAVEIARLTGEIGLGGANPTTGLTVNVGGVLGVAYGSETAPSVTFDNDPDTGLYRVSANALGITAAGALKLTVSGLVTSVVDVVIDKPTPGLVLDGSAGAVRYIDSRTAGLVRNRLLLANATAEGGSNAGSDFQVNAFDDAGTLLGAYFTGFRATRIVVFPQVVRSQGTPTGADDLTPLSYAAAIAATRAFMRC
jgi:hypothetical protein